MKICKYIAVVLAMSFMVSCSEEKVSVKGQGVPQRSLIGKGVPDTDNFTKEVVDSLDHLYVETPSDMYMIIDLWSYYLSSGQVRKIIDHASEIYNGNVISGKTDFAVISAAYMVLPYIIENQPDSARFYLNFVRSKIDENNPLWGQYNNNEAEYALRFESDYPKAMDFLTESLKFYMKKGDRFSESVLLTNIASLYSRRRDTTGMQYAKRAYDVAMDIDNVYARFISTIMMSKMECLSSDYGNAVKYGYEALEMVDDHNYFNHGLSEIYTIMGDTYRGMKDWRTAKLYYGKAFSYLGLCTDENVFIGLYLSYADYEFETGNYRDAVAYYLKGLRLSEENRNIENNHYFLYGLSNAYDRLGNGDSALYYYRLYHKAYEQAFNMYKEKEFNMLLMDYEKERYENDLAQQRLKIADSQRLIIVACAVALIVAIALVAMWIVYRKKDRMYTALVEAHQKSMAHDKVKGGLPDDGQKTGDVRSRTEMELYGKLQEIMNEKKIYREKDLSLERLADMLGSNRTYVSNIINKYAGMTFPNYLNWLRIREAIAVISDPGSRIVVKSLSDSLGYKSITSFYSAFQKETGCTPKVYREKVLKLNKEKIAGRPE